jgi:hypothetical protein
VVKNGRHAALARRHITHRGSEQVQPGLNLVTDFGAGEQPQPGSSQPDRQGNAVRGTANVNYTWQVFWRQLKLRTYLAGGLQEELDGGVFSIQYLVISNQ